MEYGITKSNVISVMENMLKNCPLNMIYYNVVFTDREIVIDYLNRSYRTWILHVKPVKEYEYNGMNVADIVEKSSENFTIKYTDIEKIVFKKRSFFTNARMEINAKGLEEKLILFSKGRINTEEYYNLVKPYLNGKVQIR